MAFTIIFNEDGTIFEVRDQNGQKVNPTTNTLEQELRGKAVKNITSTQVIIADPVSGPADPCVMHGGQLYCW